jgi:hypothetical protein
MTYIPNNFFFPFRRIKINHIMVEVYLSATGWWKPFYLSLDGGSLFIRRWLVEVYLTTTGLWKSIYLPLADGSLFIRH